MGRGASAPEIMSREKRAHIYGIDTADALVWSKWTPGGEYVRTLTVRNITATTQKLQYKLPASKYFTMDYPVPLKLAAGTSISLQVTFRPVLREAYDDVIEFQCKSGTFAVPVRATLPHALLQCPESLEFGYCPAKETTEVAFELVNAGELEVGFSWLLHAPFALHPAAGTLPPGGSQTMVASFKPAEACVFVANAVCQTTDGVDMCSMKVSAIAKLPYVTFDQPLCDFGPVLVGKAFDKTIQLVNQSLVPAAYTIVRTEADHDRVFVVRPSAGTIPPESAAAIMVSYTPLATNTSSFETFRVATAGGNSPLLTCKGSAQGPAISLSASHVSFGSVPVGSSTSRVVYLENASDVVVGWQFLTDAAGCFQLDRSSGTCGARSSVHVSLTFHPKEAAMAYKRLVCLIKDGPTPLMLEVSGTAFTETQRPPTLKQTHIDAMHWRTSQGLSAMVREEDPATHVPETAPQRFVSCMGAASMWEDVFHPDKTKPVQLDRSTIAFGACSHLRVSDYQQVTVHNHGHLKVTCFWVAPTESLGVGPNDAPRPIFTIFPETADIKPGGSSVFRVAFRPGRNNFYYSHRLECFSYVKTMRNFRLVSETAITPPWCLTVAASGHTFVAGDGSGMPKVEFTTKRVQFCPAKLGEASYSTVALINSADTPVRFDFPATLDALPGSEPQSTFSCFPVSGVVPAHQFQLIAVKFAPMAAQPHAETFKCTFNHLPTNCIDVVFAGTGCTPKLRLLPANVYFKPTCIGASSTRALSLQNTSKIPIQFSFVVPDRLRPAISVNPFMGILKSREVLPVEWTFVPTQQKQYSGRVQCMYAAASPETEETTVGEQAEEVQRLGISILGEGTPGAIVIEQATLDFGTVLAHSSSTESVEIKNLSSGNLYYSVEVRTVSTAGAAALADQEWHSVLQVEQPTGLLMAKSAKTLQMTFQPQGRCSYVFVVEVHTSHEPILSGAEGVLPGAGRDAPSLEVLAAGDLPLLRFSDVTCDGVGKSTLWRRMGVSAANHWLADVLSPNEEDMRVNVDTPKSVAAVLESLPPHVCSFAAASLGDPVTVIHAELHNVGSLHLKWAAVFGTDQEVDVETWVDLGEPPTQSVQHHQNVAERKIIDIWPRGGEMPPGHKCMVTFTYIHDFLGEHTLPVLIDVQGGKKLNLTLVGKTLPRSEQILEFIDKEHHFRAVPIGQMDAPVQTYELRNISSTNISYIVDVTSIETINTASFGFQVVECLNPQGTVPANGKAIIKWRIRPIEARTYQWESPITIVGGSTTSVRFFALGYHPRPNKPLPRSEYNLGLKSRWPGFSLEPSDDLEGAIGQQLILTTTGFELGEVPCLSITRRLVTLTSTSHYPYTFSWNMGAAAELEGSLIIEPKTGRVEPYAQIIFKVSYQAGAWPELFEVEASCSLTPVPDTPPPPTPPSGEEMLLAEGRHYEVQTARPVKVRGTVAHAHTESTMMRYPGLVLEPQQATEFATNFNMASTALESKLAMPMVATTLCLTLSADVQSQAHFRSAFGREAYDTHFLVFKTKQPVRETPPPQLPPEDVQAILTDILLDVLRDPEMVEACSAKRLSDSTPILFSQLASGRRRLPLDVPASQEDTVPVSWRDSLTYLGVKPVSQLLTSHTTQHPPPEPDACHVSQVGEQEVSTSPKKHADVKGGKKSAADIEAEEEALRMVEERKRADEAEKSRQKAEKDEHDRMMAEERRLAKVAAREAMVERAKVKEAQALERRAELAAEQAEAAAHAARRQAFIDTPECLQLAELVLEGTLFNVMKENHSTGFLF